MAHTGTLLTFEELLTRSATKRSSAWEPGKIVGWDRLLEVLRELAGDERDESLVAGRSWRLEEVTLEGFQGVTSMLPLVVDPTPGVTVLSGANGAGKSSIADAVEAALSGSVPVVKAGGGGSAPLWERSYCARDVPEAVAGVVLSDGADRLELRLRIEPRGTVLERTARLRCGTEVRDVDLGAMPWASALAAGRPVFGYAAVERRVQQAKDLREFLAPLLGLGDCLDELERAIVAAGRPASDALKRWEGALEEAQRAVAVVDARFAVARPEPKWPTIDGDPDSWLAASGLSESGEAVDPVTEVDTQRLHDASAAIEPVLREIETAERSLLARLAVPLRDLRRHADLIADPGSTCPVCSTADVPWLDTLQGSLDGLGALAEHETEFGRRLKLLRERLDDEFARIATVLDQNWVDRGVAAAAEPVRDRARELWTVVGQHGAKSYPEVRAAVRSLGDALRSDAWTRAIREAVLQSDRQRQWLRARRAAVARFLDVWRADGSLGRDAAGWRDAQGYCLRTLRAETGSERTATLRGAADGTVRRLLADVGLRINDLTVQKTKAEIEVLDGAGRVMELSMLSAGQRNALLLAPLLAIDRGGPFGFLVLDDPVHAFDMMRVDRLAALIAELAERRRVVVFTHDERLKEHLLALSPDHRGHDVERDPATGAVTHVESRPAWRSLLDDARSSLDLAKHKDSGTTVLPTDLVRGFCRMAVDAALRQFVLRVAHDRARDALEDLGALDDKKNATTEQRFMAVRTMHPDRAVEDAWAAFEPHKLAWNRAVHGNENATTFDRSELRAAERVCARLVGPP